MQTPDNHDKEEPRLLFYNEEWQVVKEDLAGQYPQGLS